MCAHRVREELVDGRNLSERAYIITPWTIGRRSERSGSALSIGG